MPALCDYVDDWPGPSPLHPGMCAVLPLHTKPAHSDASQLIRLLGRGATRPVWTAHLLHHAPQTCLPGTCTQSPQQRPLSMPNPCAALLRCGTSSASYKAGQHTANLGHPENCTTCMATYQVRLCWTFPRRWYAFMGIMAKSTFVVPAQPDAMKGATRRRVCVQSNRQQRRHLRHLTTLYTQHPESTAARPRMMLSATLLSRTA